MAINVVEFLLSGFTDNSGEPLAGGKVYTYKAGTTTAKAVYTDNLAQTPSANPIILDSNGRKQVYAAGTYKFVVKDANDSTLYTFDNLFFDYDYPTTQDEIATYNALGLESVIKSEITLTGNLTVNAPLKVLKGGMLITDGHILTINGPFTAGRYQTFITSFAETVFGASAATEILPEWFNLPYLAFDAANTAVIPVVVRTAVTLGGDYTINAPIEFVKGGSIVTDGNTLTINGPIKAGFYQIFTAASGEVVIGPYGSEEVVPQWWGAVADSSTDDTSPVQKALNCGRVVRFPIGNGKYKVGLLTIPTTVKRICGEGAILQKTAGPNVFEVTGSTIGLTIEEIQIYGVAGSGITASDNTGIYAVSCDNLTIQDVYFQDLRFCGARIDDCSNVKFLRNRSSAISDAIVRFRAVKYGIIGWNIIKDTQLGAGTLTNAILVDTGTNGHAFGLGSDILVIGNVISGYPCSQAIFGHAAVRVSVVGNVIYDSCIPIYFAPFSGAGAADIVSDLTIQGNTVYGTSQSVTEPSQNGIFVGGGSLSRSKNVSIVGNTIVNANADEKDPASGGIAVGYVDTCVISGNSIRDSYENGIVVINPCLALLITDNTIKGITKTTQSNGIRVTTEADGSTGKICNNFIDTAEYAIRFAADSPNIEISGNNFSSLTAGELADNSFAVINGRVPYTAGDTTPSVRFNARYIDITNAGAVSITNFDDGRLGQVITCVFHDANTTVTRGTTMKLAASTNFTSANYSTLTLAYDGTTWNEVSRVTNNG